jgi:hypothetical protein
MVFEDTPSLGGVKYRKGSPGCPHVTILYQDPRYALNSAYGLLRRVDWVLFNRALNTSTWSRWYLGTGRPADLALTSQRVMNSRSEAWHQRR